MTGPCPETIRRHPFAPWRPFSNSKELVNLRARPVWVGVWLGIQPIIRPGIRPVNGPNIWLGVRFGTCLDMWGDTTRARSLRTNAGFAHREALLGVMRAPPKFHLDDRCVSDT
jgi:hypothetical protein